MNLYVSLRVLHREWTSPWYALTAGVAMTAVLRMAPEAEGHLRGCTSYNGTLTLSQLGQPGCRGVVPPKR